MSKQLKIMMAQINGRVGDIPGNTERVVEEALYARELGADLVMFPELTLSGYPPEDLLFRDSLQIRIEQALEQVRKASNGIALVVGYPLRKAGKLYNVLGIFQEGELVCEYAKQHLPSYQVFDEHRYFTEGDQAGCVTLNEIPISLTICEDIWHPGPAYQAKEQGARLMLNINASPFHIGKSDERKALLAERAQQAGCPIFYLNQVGGQDELVFDGGSQVTSRDGECLFLGTQFEEAHYLVEYNDDDQSVKVLSGEASPDMSLEQSVYQALVVGVRDYVEKNGFRGVVFGLSGGIDSALTAAVAVDALGPERVAAVMMPFRYTSSMSLEDAEKEATALGIDYSLISIEPMFESFMTQLAPAFQGTRRDTTEENLQARCRGVLLMALSNKRGYLVLTTGNKSEMAVGYSTLYGDMAGGFDVLKDVPKSLVFKLSRYRNTLSPVIPERVIERPPSAELAPDQKDEDSLPPYDQLDRILELYIEQDYSAEAIVAEGFDSEDVYRVIRLVDINEYKRRQAPVGVRVTHRGFGRDRRYPITNGWKAGI